MTQRVAHGHFEKFAQSRLEFVRNIASLAEREEYLESLLDEDAFGMLKGLLHDRVATVQQTAALAIGRMAGFSIELSEELVKTGILEHLTSSVRGSLPGHMKAAAFVIRSVAKHTEVLCQCCIESQCCQTLVWCMEQLDATVREAAASSLATLASHAASQAVAVVEAGALPLLVAAMQEPEASLKRAASSTLAEIAKHSPELAMAVIEAGALPVLVALLKHSDAKLRRQAANTLGHIVKHTAIHAEAGVQSKLFPPVLVCMQDSDLGVRRQAGVVMREVVKHSAQLASVVVECGGIGSAVEALTSRAGTGLPSPTATVKGMGMGHTQGGHAGQAGAAVESLRLAPIMALGFIAAFSETLAQGVVSAGGVGALKETLLQESEEHVRAAVVWALGQLGKHSASHANALAAADVLRHILAGMMSDDASDDVREKSRRCLTSVLAVCTHVPAMEALLPACPGPLAKVVLRQFVTVLRRESEARKSFLASGGLKMVQAFDPTIASLAGGAMHGATGMPAGFTHAFLAAASTGAADGDTGEYLEAINSLYPAEVVQYCRPDYFAKLSKKIAGELDTERKAATQTWLKAQYNAELAVGTPEGKQMEAAAEVAALPEF